MKFIRSKLTIGPAFLLSLTCCSVGVADHASMPERAPTDGTAQVLDAKTRVEEPSIALERHPAYLALGDSVAFGEDGFIPWTDPSRNTPLGFVGYPELLAFDPLLHGVVNLACPGETTGSFLSAAATDHGCREYKALHSHGLHTNYAGETQAEATRTFLRESARTRLVTLNLGGNDLLLVLDGCASATDLASCATAALPGAIAQAATNVGDVLGVIRGSGYGGRIVLLTQYSTNYNDPLQSASLPPFNGALSDVATHFGATIADGYAVFRAGSQAYSGDPCAAGLLIPNPNGDGTCDKHPSHRGQALLALAVLRASQ
jgi:GDSL-like Lipase/Acylhydrolase family